MKKPGRRRPPGEPPEPLARREARQYAAWFRALADPTRIQIVTVLARASGPLTVGQIVAATDVTQATVSQHLKVLAGVRFVLADRRGTARYYRLNEACVGSFPTAADLVVGRAAPDPAITAPAAMAAASPPAATPSAASPPATSAPAASLPAPDPPDGVSIRPMASGDAAQVLAIYQAGLDSGEASFETVAPSWADFDAARLPGHRLVAVAGGSGEVLGWAAVSRVSDRCVYEGVVEHSIYVADGARGRGVGAALLRALIASTAAAGIWTIQSGIFPENTASLRLHERAGFRVVGIRQRIGRHHDRWRDVLLLERRTNLPGTA
ncbi:MAG TPA: metalloregulator ArsR/SmtB family transcription factor [Streptosporangiaceae bacterium]